MAQAIPFRDRTWCRLLWCLVLGALSATSMPPYCTPALILGLSFFWLTLTDFKKKWHAPVAGFLFGFGYFVGSIWWVGNALLVGGNPYLWALPLAVSGLQAILAVFPMVGSALSQWLYPGRSLSAYLFFVAMMGLAEWARGSLFTGFPWNLFGMIWTYNLEMLQILSVGGVYLLSLLTIFMFTVPAFAVAGTASRRVRLSLLVLSFSIGVSLFAWGSFRLHNHPTTYNPDVMVQNVTPNIPQEEKWDPALFWTNYVKTIQAIAPARMDSAVTGKTRMIVLPETALHYEQLADVKAKEELQRILGMYPEKTYLLTGLLRKATDPVTKEDSYHNSLVGLDQSTTEVFAFDKFHLVPFGEYIPFQKYIPIGPVVSFAGFDSGPGPRTIDLDGVPGFSPLVCYEVIFPGAVTAEPRPQWMVNVTNDAWYGVSPGPHQHLGQAVYRAIEEGLPMIRSTNTGFSAIIDAYGRILVQSGLYKDDVQTLNLPQAGEKTLYSVAKQYVFFFILSLFCVPALAGFLNKTKGNFLRKSSAKNA